MKPRLQKHKGRWYCSSDLKEWYYSPWFNNPIDAYFAWQLGTEK